MQLIKALGVSQWINHDILLPFDNEHTVSCEVITSKLTLITGELK